MRRETKPAWFAVAVLFGSSLAGCSSPEGSQPQSGPAAPEIVELSAAPPLIDFGGSTQLVWKTRGAGRVQLREGPLTLLDTASAPNGVFSVSPTISTTYFLEASGEGGKTNAAVLVQVRPKVLRLETDAVSEVVIGQPVLVSWETGGARELTLQSGEHHLQPIPESRIRQGSLWVAAPENGVFTLFAKSGELEATRSVGVSSRPQQPPTIELFRANPAFVTTGQGAPVEIAWLVSDATRISLQVAEVVVDLNDRSPQEDRIVLPIKQTSELSLVATNAAGRDQRTFLVEAVPAPTIDLFHTPQTRVPPNHPVFLRWETTGTTSVSIFLDDEPIAQDLSPAGELVHPVVFHGTFRLRAFNRAGIFAEEERSILVGPPLIQHFGTDRPAAAAETAVTLAWEVEGGTLLQILNPDRIPIPACATSDLPLIRQGSCTVLAPGTLGEYAYELQVSDGVTEIQTATVTIRVVDGPTIERFEVTPSSLDLGGSVTISWETEPDRNGLLPLLRLQDNRGNPAYDLDGRDAKGDSITLALTSPGPYTFTLEAETPETTPASANASAMVYALAHATLIAGTPIFDPVFGFYEIELSYTTENATTLQIWQLDPEGNLLGEPLFATEDPYELEEGSLLVFPAETSVYRVLVTNGNGTRFQEDLTVFVGPEALEIARARR